MKDLVEHIRTVHFTVLIVALVLTAALRFEQKRTLVDAANDAEALLQLSQRWDETVTTITKEVDRKVLQEHVNRASVDPSQSGTYQVIYFPRPHNGLSANFTLNSPWLYIEEKEDGTYGVGTLDKWKTLNDFLRFWDRFYIGKNAFVLVSLEPSDTAESCQRLRQLSRRIESIVPISYYLDYKIQSKANSLWQIQPRIILPSRNNDSPALEICAFQPVTVSSLAIDLGRTLQSVSPQAAKWGNSGSADTFTDLIAGSKYLQDTPLANLALALRDHANTDTERIEIFQAKLPASAIPTFGSLVLILCEIYLLAHLLELRTVIMANLSSEWPSGYIGLYENSLIFLFTLASLNIFPLIPLILSSISNFGWLRYLSIAVCAISLLLSVGCSRVLISIRMQHKHLLSATT